MRLGCAKLRDSISWAYVFFQELPWASRRFAPYSETMSFLTYPSRATPLHASTYIGIGRRFLLLLVVLQNTCSRVVFAVLVLFLRCSRVVLGVFALFSLLLILLLYLIMVFMLLLLQLMLLSLRPLLLLLAVLYAANCARVVFSCRCYDNKYSTNLAVISRK